MRLSEDDRRSLVRRLPAAALVLLVALFLAWLVAKSAVVNAFSKSYPRVAAGIAPNDPRVAAGLVAADLQAHMAVARPATKQAARRALLRAPLGDDPFLIAGVDHLLRRDYRGAAPFLERALTRNPRSRIARLFVLDLELRGGQAEAAAADMTILSRLLPDVQKVFMPELAKFAADAETRAALQTALRSDPKILNQLLFYLASHGSSPQVVLSLAGAHPPPRDPELPDWRRALLDAMVSKGNLPGAFALWKLEAGVPADAPPGLYDGGFRRLRGTPPFNWSFTSNEMGVAEPSKRGGLEVEYYGRTKGELASQLVMLQPGRYRLILRAEGDIDDSQPRLVWRVLCQKTGAALLELPLANVSYAGRTVAGDFTVPAGCTGQWVKLFGEPTEFPKIENVSINAMKIQPVGSAA